MYCVPGRGRAVGRETGSSPPRNPRPSSPTSTRPPTTTCPSPPPSAATRARACRTRRACGRQGRAGCAPCRPSPHSAAARRPTCTAQLRGSTPMTCGAVCCFWETDRCRTTRRLEACSTLVEVWCRVCCVRTTVGRRIVGGSNRASTRPANKARDAAPDARLRPQRLRGQSDAREQAREERRGRLQGSAPLAIDGNVLANHGHPEIGERRHTTLLAVGQGHVLSVLRRQDRPSVLGEESLSCQSRQLGRRGKQTCISLHS